MWTMTEKIIALVDYENIGTLEHINLSRYEHLILFTGPQQEFIRFPATTQTGNISVSVFQAPCISKNNVDFHLVLEMGRLSVSAHDGITFHVISNDKGYDSVIALLRSTGRPCCRIASPPPERQTSEPEPASGDEVRCLADKIQLQSRKFKKNRPANTKSLINYIRAHSGNISNVAVLNQVKHELIRRNLITVYEKTVVWRE